MLASTLRTNVDCATGLSPPTLLRDNWKPFAIQMWRAWRRASGTPIRADARAQCRCNVDLTVSDPAPGPAGVVLGSVLKAVTVTVRWKQGSEDESVSVTTLVHGNGIGAIRRR